MSFRTRLCSFVAALCLASSGCDDDGGETGGDDHDHDNESEQITRVTLTFTPEGGGTPVVASFSDPDGDGGASGSSEPIELATGTTYALQLQFSNELADEDLTTEIADEAEEHLVFIYGADVAGPGTANADGLLTHAYADVESDYAANAEGDDLPVGLANAITTSTAGSGELRVMLRHLPPIDGAAQKVDGLPALLADGEPVPGNVDVDVRFDVTVQ